MFKTRLADFFHSVALFFILKGYRQLTLLKFGRNLKRIFLYPYYRIKSRQIYNQLVKSSSSNWELYVKIKEVENICNAMEAATEYKTNLVAALLSYRLCLLGFYRDTDDGKQREMSNEDFLCLQKDFAVQRERTLQAIADVENLNGRNTADLKAFIESFRPTELIPVEELERLIDKTEAEYRKITYAPLY